MHKPVLLQESIDLLQPERGRYFIDATVDGGGHAEAILSRMSEKGILVGIDQDDEMLARAKKRIRDKRFHAVYGNFSHIENVTKPFFKRAHGILFDLGISSLQFEESGRGFTFQKDEPLDMRYDIHGSFTAENALNSLPEIQLADIFWKYGEERFARRIAKRIIEARKEKPIHTTFDVVRIIEKAIPKRFQHHRIHPATKTFQALRIAVNDELRALEEGIHGAWNILSPKGRLVIISFHSLEDRIVKHTFRAWEKEKGVVLRTKKPIIPSEKEIRENPRARSAKLRAIQKP